MKSVDQDSAAEAALRSDFTTTHWSLVLAAGQDSSPDSQAALEKLCRSYWYPLYSYVRRQGRNPEDAKDLTQDFFERLLRKQYLSLANPERGKFRTFLLTSLKRVLVNEWQKDQTQKRGGGQEVFSLDLETTEERYQAELADQSSPDKIFEKRWAVTLLENVLARLRSEFNDAGKGEQFERLKVLLWGEQGSSPYAQVATELGMTEGALKVAVHRLRQRYRELLRAEVAHTVASPGEVDEELRYLIAVIGE